MAIKYTTKQTELQPSLAAANINPESFLATDYLNHFNEIVMLLEMIPDMPELLEDTEDWEPKSYKQHFEDSGFQAKGLAISAFDLAPREIKAAFENVCSQLDKSILTTLAGLKTLNVAERGFSPQARDLIQQRVANIQELLMKLNQVVHGKPGIVLQFEVPQESKEPSEKVETQEDIDKLFD